VIFDLSDEELDKVDELIRRAMTIRGAILAVSHHLNLEPAQVAEYVTVFRTGRFDIVPDDGPDSDDKYAKSSVEEVSEHVAIHNHGELGPVIGDPNHDFT
jgi:ABC-type sugar transport system ATPase subunit